MIRRAAANLTRPLIAMPLAAACALLAAGAATVPTAGDSAEARPLVVRLTPEEIVAMRTQGEQRYKVGIVKHLGAEIGFESLKGKGIGPRARSVAGGVLRDDGKGGFDFTLVVQSAGASKLRVRLSGLFLPRNTSLYAYNSEGETDGPYTGRGPSGDGELWTRALNGDELTLRLEYTGTDTARVLGAARFVVADVGHVDAPVAGVQTGEQLCTFNAQCVENVSCNTLPPSIAYAQNAVAEMLFASGRYLYICTGGLLADTDDTSQRPLFLTANHCIGKAREAKSLQTFFNYVTSCGGACAGFQNSGLPGTNGATILAKGSGADYTLLQLDQAAPAGATFLDWNADPVAFSHGAPLYRISHPSGAPQAYSEHRVDTSAPTCGATWARGNRIYSRDTLGAAEGGSSGSPVLNAAGEVVGQLSGSCGLNLDDECDAAGNATVDGALAAYFSSVAPFLDPTPPPVCNDLDADGFSCDDCNDADASVYPGAPESCSDAVDKNCDGTTGESAPECSSGSCDLGAVGDSCTINADCCGNKCKGRSGAKTCK
jgi:lysyl endopeptidase